MNIPSLKIPAHERYSPELGDKISDLLRMQAEGASYHLPTPTQLRALAEIESAEAPILACIYNLMAIGELAMRGEAHSKACAQPRYGRSAIGGRCKENSIDRADAGGRTARSPPRCCVFYLYAT